MVRRVLLALVAGLLLAGGLTFADASGPAAANTVALRLTIETSSDWTTVTLHDGDVRAETTRSTSANTKHFWAKGEQWIVNTAVAGRDTTAVVDMVVELTDGVLPTVTVDKGRVGTATVAFAPLDGGATSTILLTTNDPYRNSITRALRADTLAAADLVVPPVDPRGLTLAFYYPWFGANARGAGSFGPDHPTGASDTFDGAEVAAMVDQARTVGVDGFLVSWDGNVRGGGVDRLFEAVATRPDFTLAPVIELLGLSSEGMLGGETLDVGAAAAATRDFLARVPAHARLAVDGRPVVVVFGMWKLEAHEWQAYLAQLGDLDPFVVGDRADPSFAVDGLYEYEINGWSRAELTERYDRYVDTARYAPALEPGDDRLLWAATVSPGHDSRRDRGLLAGEYTARAGGARYDLSWEVATASAPDWIFITSWNEWFEQTHIAPGTETGRRALDQTAAWTNAS